MADAFGVLLTGREDDDIAEYFIETAFPPTVRMEQILRALEASDPATLRELEADVNMPHMQIEKALKLLEVDGAVAHERGRYFRTSNAWRQDEERIAGVMAARRAELAQMRAYVDTEDCRMGFIARVTAPSLMAAG